MVLISVIQRQQGRKKIVSVASRLFIAAITNGTPNFYYSATTTTVSSYHSTTTNNCKNKSLSWSDLVASRSSGGSGGSGGVSNVEDGNNNNNNNNNKYERPSWSKEWKEIGLGAELVDTTTGEGEGALNKTNNFPENLYFVQVGVGVDQHGERNIYGYATKAAIRAVRNAIEFNSIPGVIQHIPGGRKEMLIHVKLGVPISSKSSSSSASNNNNDDDNNNNNNNSNNTCTSIDDQLSYAIDPLEVAKVFPYGKLLPIEIVVGGLDYHSGRVVEELGDDDDVAICCVACISIGYNNNNNNNNNNKNNYADSKDKDDDDNTNNTNIRKQTVHKIYSTKDGY